MGAKYQPYPDYKYSQYEWIGKIPKHWKEISLKRACFLTTGLTPPTNEESNYSEQGYPWVRPEDIDETGEPTEASKFVTKKGWGLLRKVKPGSSLICCIGTIGKCGYTKDTVSTNQQITAATFYKNKKFNYYLLTAARKSIEEAATGNVLKILNSERLGALGFVEPPEKEGDVIADFLDHETSKIDTLIEKQQQLIKLLKEKRQAVISHAVTKGLNPDVPMKDSGVEWLGEVPDHWNVKPLRYLGECQNGINIGAEYFGSGYPFVSYGDVYNNRTLPKEVKGLVQSTRSDREKYSVLRGDVFFTRTSETIEEIGFSSICESTIKKSTFAGFLIRFRPKNNLIVPEFSKYVFQNISLRDFFIKEMNLVTRASLSQDLLKKMPVPLPPKKVQLEISNYLSEKERVFDALIENAVCSIKLAQERRTALISAAVTGKIDVRNWQPQSATDMQQETTPEPVATPVAH